MVRVVVGDCMWEVECMREGGEGREVVSVDHWNVGSLDGLFYKAAEGQRL